MPPRGVYSLITDLPTLAELAEETIAMSGQGRFGRARRGVQGEQPQRQREWTTTCTVTEAEPGRLFAFDVEATCHPVAHWRYDINPGEDGCTRHRAHVGPAAGLAPQDRGSSSPACPTARRRTAEHIKLTLQRLKARAER